MGVGIGYMCIELDMLWKWDQIWAVVLGKCGCGRCVTHSCFVVGLQQFISKHMLTLLFCVPVELQFIIVGEHLAYFMCNGCLEMWINGVVLWLLNMYM